MKISPTTAAASDAMLRRDPTPPAVPAPSHPTDPALHKAFQDFVGQTFYTQMLSAMRKSVGPPAYFHGGRAEEVFQTQLDQVLAEKLSNASAETLAEPMYQLFTLPRR
jgi:hypothetical protein